MTAGEASTEVVTVDESAEGRLDGWLAARLSLSRTRIVALIRQGHVLVDGRPARKSDPVSPGQRIEVEIPALEELTAEPQDIPVDIVYQDASLLVVNKPAGLVVHPAPGHPSGTLVNALLHHVRDLSGVGGTLRPGIVHRLDRYTSGLMVVAKDDQAHLALSQALKERRVRRLYLAASWGHLPKSPLTIDGPIGRHPTDRKKMAVTERGRLAVTRCAVDERWRAAELLRVSLGTGRTHQIRVHLSHIGHPVVGDAVYGAGRERGMSGPARSWARELARRTPRQFLHAAELSFAHPRTGEESTFEAALPPDLAEVAAWARENP